MRVLVTRPIHDATPTAERLRALGHAPVVAPLTRLVATGAAIPQGEFDALIATSANAVDLLEAESVARLRGVPFYCVGDRATVRARARGLLAARPGAADATRLAHDLGSALAPGQRVLYLAGRDRKPTLEKSLVGGGYRVTSVEIYRAEAVESLPVEAARPLRAGDIDAALHYSGRAVDLLIALAEAAGLGTRLTRVAHVCISEEAATPLRHAGAKIVVAATPDSDGLFAALQIL